MIRLVFLLGLIWPWSLWADSVVPTRTIRAQSIIAETDVILRRDGPSTGIASVGDVIGQEARVVLYPGRPIAVADIGPPALVKRNQVVRVTYEAAGLRITTEARALERGGVGDLVRIMNLTSRATLFGQIKPDGTIEVIP